MSISIIKRQLLEGNVELKSYSAKLIFGPLTELLHETFVSKLDRPPT
jgi:hypothetical protein